MRLLLEVYEIRTRRGARSVNAYTHGRSIGPAVGSSSSDELSSSSQNPQVLAQCNTMLLRSDTHSPEHI